MPQKHVPTYQEILSDMANQSTITVTLQFYADKPEQYENKLFTFNSKTRNECFKIMLYFAVRGNHFRKAYHNVKLKRYNQPDVIAADSLQTFVDYFNQCEYDKPPTLQEAINDFKMTYEL